MYHVLSSIKWDLPMAPPAFFLRPPRYEDASAYCAFIADPDVTVWLEDRCQRPLALPQAQAFLVGDAWCRWAIESDGAFVGVTGLEDYDPTRGVARFFIVLGERSVWGKGLGLAVLRAVLSHGFDRLGLRKVTSDYLESNKGSRIIHHRAGFTVEGRARQDRWRRGQWVDRVFLSILSEEFRAAEHGQRPA
jgi:RimJ/RimL family protein N-acetyltransferase